MELTFLYVSLLHVSIKPQDDTVLLGKTAYGIAVQILTECQDFGE